MKEITMYMHGGSENHGCEAIVRSTIDIIDSPSVLYSRKPRMDSVYGIDKICKLESRGEAIKRFRPQWFALQIKKRLTGDPLAFIRHNYCNIINEADQNRLYLSIGGDNYCGDLVPALQYTNEQLNDRGVWTVLWGCSIDPEFIDKKENQSDLARYKRIFAREKTTYNALLRNGFEDTVRYYPDPAFTLKQEEWKLPDVFSQSKVIGINISPYVQKSGSEDIVFASYRKLIEYILDETDCSVALIPHVIWDESDDRIPLQRLYDLYEGDRVVYIEDRNCKQLKYCIANCYMLVTARTHASIAGYSTCVPTLVVGYSMKSLALAKDIFDNTEHFVVAASEMKTGDELLDAFKWQFSHRDEIEKSLKNIMPDYIEQARQAGDEIRGLMRQK